ncbi:DgyrCDS10550 [Dimorphilus gyrociliatus]|uniref:DgyrCDS10550 n=1 Tax=Dimorphilus gyrociliatus TaxID=2664684 RepID=A0A7I8W0J4_9ANNE|nr:DgyrCDS10550 [Dimorphilus gyrociliatus]
MADFQKKLENLTKFHHLSKSVKEHLKCVYGTLAIGMALAAAGAYVHIFTALLRNGFLTLIASIACLFALYSTPHNRTTEKRRLAYFGGFTFCAGISLGPLLERLIMIDPSIITTALTGTAMIFICFSLSTLYSNKRPSLFLGGLLSSGISCLLVVSLANIFFRSNLIFQFELYVGFGIFCLFVIYDTQMIIYKRENGDDDYIKHSLDLFIDMIEIFRYLAIILGNKEQGKKKKRDD